MNFAELVTADYNRRHLERVREGKAAIPQDMGDWLYSICNVLDKYGVYKPGKSTHFRDESRDADVPTFEELGLKP